MKNLTSLRAMALLAAMALFNTNALASVAYNLTGWDATGTGGIDGGLPAHWIGSAAPVYSGSLNAMWFADLASANSTEHLSSSGARGLGADPTFALAIGPLGWSSDSTGTLGKGHGSDFGLIHLNSVSDLTITAAADSSSGSMLIPGFSLFQGWDSGATSVRIQNYQNNQNNPLGTQGLSFLNSASTNMAGGSASFTFANLSAGDYTLFIGGNATTTMSMGGMGMGIGAGNYLVTLAASPVPVPGAAWLFGSALFGLLNVGRLRCKVWICSLCEAY